MKVDIKFIQSKGRKKARIASGEWSSPMIVGCYNDTSRTKLTSFTCGPARSSRTGIKSSSSLS